MKLRVATTGSGPRRAALVHGLGNSGATWGPLAERMAERGWTVLAPDLRGHGASPRADDYTMAAYADDLVETLPAGLDLVVGHSLGGSVLRFAAGRLAPARAVYLDPGFGIRLPVEGAAAKLFWAAPKLSLGVVGLLGLPATRKREAGCSERVRALLQRAKADADPAMIIPTFHDAALTKMRAPEDPAVPSTVLLSAESGQVVPEELAAGLAGRGWEVRRAPQVRHSFWLEDLDYTVESLRDLL
ncbi:alpha/beta fold hydrolase [Actinokineospora bangkokensis]|uniref:AB hydrolase-1 domain-containing protein n=1 Tax=Actinokineospora bangkokensis TaxID=1193682 RepID=A0A1Q9LN31_9PSEU|nr:alpha/beta hydrolase [Actinokineospora bangkokensis]OLR93456.1 hypothetical protein BJP25_14195 [Actinokineospora bangkokensis]